MKNRLLRNVNQSSQRKNLSMMLVLSLKEEGQPSISTHSTTEHTVSDLSVVESGDISSLWPE